jgi:phage regulator Rha-like protein
MTFHLAISGKTLTMTSREIADLTGKEHKHVMRDIRDMIARLEEHNSTGPNLDCAREEHNSNLSRAQEAAPDLGALEWHCETEHYLDANGRAREQYRLDKATTHCLIAGYDPVPRMRIIRRLESLETGAIPPPVANYLDAKLRIGQAAIDWLRLSDTSKLRMLSDIAISEGVAPTFLPAYTDEGLTRALTALLKEHGSPLSAKAANLAMIDMGYLAEMERKGSKGDAKRFKSLTERGLQYGRNETSPQNPRETQPLYYVAKFSELLDLINAHLSDGVSQ